MTIHKDFHESYYEHNCTITGTEDVLESEFPENNFRNKVKKWWFDWFLVSYNDERARLYFSSSHAMRMERYRQYRSYRNRIHPLSRFRNAQNIFMFVLFFVNALVFHHNMSITFGQLYRGLYYLGAAMELIIIVDIILNCHTGYIDTETGRIVLGRRLGLLHYGSTKLFMHVASALPLQCVMLLRYGYNVDCTMCKINLFIITLKFFSIFTLFRIYEHSNFLTWERSSIVTTHVCKFLRIYLVGMMITLYYIDLSDNFILVYMISTGKLIDTAFVSELITVKFVEPDPPSNYRFFIYAFGRITKSIFLFNLSGGKYTEYHLDTITSMGAYVLANLLFMWQVLECHNFLFRLCYLDDRVSKLKQALDNLCRCRRLPDRVSDKLVSYYDYNQSKLRAMEITGKLLMYLPEILKTESLLTRHTRLFRRIPYFSEWPLDIVEHVVLMLKEEIYLTDDLVAEPWVQSEGLLIVGMGELAVYDEKTEIGHLIDGDYFGEFSLVTDKEQRTSSAVAITSCVMLLLEKSAFRAYMRQYPELFAALKHEILEAIASKNRQE